MNDFYNCEYLSERVAALAKERDELKKIVRKQHGMIERLTAMASVVKRAKWDKPIEHGLPYKANHLGVVCSGCCSWSDNMYSYCPNCGARMDGDGK